MRTTLHQVNASTMEKTRFAIAYLKYSAHPCVIMLSLVSTYSLSCCDNLWVMARTFDFTERTARLEMSV